MRLKALLLAVLVAGFSASWALADPGGRGHGKGGGGRDDAAAALTTSTTSTAEDGEAVVARSACRPKLELELRGTVDSASATSVAVLVTRGGAKGARLDGERLVFDLAHARVRGTLAAGAPVRVHGRACVDLAAGTVALAATQVDAR